MLDVITEFGPDINHKDRFSRTPLHFSARAGNQTAVTFLLEKGLTATEPASQILVDAQTIGGESPLMKACECGHMDICISLLQAGCNPFLTDNMGRNAVVYARVNHPDREIHTMLQTYMDTITS